VPAEQVESGLAPDLLTIVDGFGSVGPRHVGARLVRKRADRWAGALIGAVRDGRIEAPENSALTPAAPTTSSFCAARCDDPAGGGQASSASKADSGERRWRTCARSPNGEHQQPPRPPVLCAVGRDAR